MRVSFEWLSQYVDLEGISPEDVANKLTSAGVEVDLVKSRDTGIQGVVVGDVIHVEKHPNADKLSVCQVRTGEGEPSTIVCGAPNVAAGQRVPVAKPGARLPRMKIKRAKLRGVESNGMICSASELGLDEKMLGKMAAEGIMVLPDDTPVGADVRDVLGLDDVVLELDLTPNRSDCLSMFGMAYEVAALFDRPLNLPQAPAQEGTDERPAAVRLEAGNDCPLYTLQVVKNVRIGPSPQWMQNRLMAAGVRPINNVVDITNYIMLEYGQPLHAFDYDTVAGGTIVVRYARDGETIETLDGVKRRLDGDMVVITDGRRPVGIGGVMGGANSEIRPDTHTVLIESAYFDPLSISRTSRKLGLRSEASSRFEKTVDRSRVLPALRRAVALMGEWAGGEVASKEVVQETEASKPVTVTMRYRRMNDLLGTAINPDDVRRIFDRLRFPYRDGGEQIVVEVPTRRPDISLEVDLIEEVARLYGYDNIPMTLPRGESARGGLTQEQALKRTIKRTLQGLGLFEVVTYAFTSREKNEQVASLNEGLKAVKLKMPMSEDRSVLRTGLLPGLLDVAEYNVHRQNERIAIFELGRTFATDEEPLGGLPREEEELAGFWCGPVQTPNWTEKGQAVDFFTVKGLLEALFRRLGIERVTYEPASVRGFHPGRTAAIRVGDTVVGYVGQLHPQVAAGRDLPESYAFQMKLAPLLEAAKGQAVRYVPLPRYPSITRDLAVVVAEDVPVGDLVALIRTTGGSMLESVSVFDVYTGKPIEAGKKSVAFSLVYRNPERTLTDEEVNERHNKIVRALNETYGAALR